MIVLDKLGIPFKVLVRATISSAIIMSLFMPPRLFADEQSGKAAMQCYKSALECDFVLVKGNYFRAIQAVYEHDLKKDFISMIYERLVLMRDLLAEDGSIYVHCDWKTSGYMHVVMDEVFGKNNFRNEIIWHYPGREMHIGTKFNCKHDTLFFYVKSDKAILRMENVAIPYDKEERLKGLRRKVHTDENGKEWVWETRGQASGQEPYKRCASSQAPA